MQSPRQREIFEQRVLAPVMAHDKKSSQALCGFMAMKGDKYDNKLMVVGRAVNSWGDGKSTTELQDPAARGKFIDQFYFQDGECQMRWLTSDVHSTSSYNTNSSAFWRVVRRVSGRLCGWQDGTKEDWASHLVWSNLYKVSPHTGGNPSDRLCEIQESGCIELLREEIREYAPEKILFLTGWNWARPFLEDLGSEVPVVNGLVEASGTISVPGRNKSIPFVVARHPQGKPETDWVESVILSFEVAGTVRLPEAIG